MDPTLSSEHPSEPLTLVNVFQTAAGSQDELVRTVLGTACEVASGLPGFLGATVLSSVDGERVINHSRWLDRAALDQFLSDPRTAGRLAAAGALGESDAHEYITAGEALPRTPPSAVAIYRRMQQLIATQDWDGLSEVVDVDAYTENCLGLTPGWITGFEAAVQNYTENVASGVDDVTVTELDAIDADACCLVRSMVEAVHTGEFLGIPATGRRFSYEILDFVKLTGGRITWRWLLMDLYGVHRQLTVGDGGRAR